MVEGLLIVLIGIVICMYWDMIKIHRWNVKKRDEEAQRQWDYNLYQQDDRRFTESFFEWKLENARILRDQEKAWAAEEEQAKAKQAEAQKREQARKMGQARARAQQERIRESEARKLAAFRAGKAVRRGFLRIWNSIKRREWLGKSWRRQKRIW